VELVIAAAVGGVLLVVLMTVIWKIVSPARRQRLTWLIHTFGNERSAKEVEERWQAGWMNDADRPHVVKGLYQVHIDGGKKASRAGEKGDGVIGALLKEPNGTVIQGAEISERLKDPVAGPTTAEYKALLAGLKMAREDHHVEYIDRGELAFVPLARLRTHRIKDKSGLFRWYNDYRLPESAAAGPSPSGSTTTNKTHPES
jgi:Reverse transcriptase-like